MAPLTRLSRMLSLFLVASAAGCSSGVESVPDAGGISQTGTGRAGWPPDLVLWADKASARFHAPTLQVEALPADAVLLDVRTPAEVAVSRIPGAVVLYEQPEFTSTAPVVAYCTAGWRSAEVTLQLRSRGLQAFNLEGGICAWAAARRPLVDGSGAPTRTIHTFSDAFAGLVPEHCVGVIEDEP